MIFSPLHHLASSLQILILLGIFLIPVVAKSQKTKKIREVSENKVVIKEYHVLKSYQNTKHGSFKEFFKKVLITEGSYKKGKRDGLWNFNDYGGLVNFNGKYNRGLKDSIWTYYMGDTLQARLYYSAGERDSAFSYYADGSLNYSKVSHSNKAGESILYYQNRALKVYIPYINSKKEGIAIQGFENGNVFRKVEFKTGRPWNLIETLNIKGDPIYGGSLKNGTGTYIEYNIDISADSTMKPIFVVTYKDGNLEEPFVSYPNGDTPGEKGNYLNNRKVGEWLSYNKDEILDTVMYKIPKSAPIEASDTEDLISGNLIFNRDVIFPGYYPEGDNGLMQYLADNIKYPDKAKDQNIQGTVYVTFTVDEAGEIISQEILRSRGDLLDKESIRVISLLPRWNPLFSNGLPRQLRYNLPVRYTLR